jgi:hypothetical protein
VIELYAVADHPGPPLPSIAPLRVVAAGDLGIVCGPAGSDDVSPDALWRHADIVDALMEDRDLLPFRYGTRVPDEAAAVSAVDARRHELVAALDRVRGAVELSVRVLGEDRPAEAGEYLRRRADVDAVHAALGKLARASERRATGMPAELLRAAYLVDRDTVARFSAAVADLQAAHPELSLLCTGPWAPYTFTTP